MRDRPDSTAIPDEDSPLLPELAQFLETAGINHPFTKVCAALRFSGSDLDAVRLSPYCRRYT
jgi:hypothetical protein